MPDCACAGACVAVLARVRFKLCHQRFEIFLWKVFVDDDDTGDGGEVGDVGELRERVKLVLGGRDDDRSAVR